MYVQFIVLNKINSLIHLLIPNFIKKIYLCFYFIDVIHTVTNISSVPVTITYNII